MESSLLKIKKFCNLLNKFTEKLSDAKDLVEEVSENFSKKASKTTIRRFSDIQEEIREAQDDLDAAQDTLDDIKDAGFCGARFARHFAELQDMFKELVSEVSDAKDTAEAATISEGDADVDVKESVNNFSKVVEVGTKKVLKLFSDLEDQLDTLADDTETAIDKVKVEDKSEEAQKVEFSRKGNKVNMNNKFSKLLKVSNFSEVEKATDEDVEALAENLEEAVNNFCDVAEKEALTEEEKKELVGCFSDLGTGLDAITEVVNQENLEKLAKIVNYAKKKLAKFCDAHTEFSARSRMKLNKVMRFFSEELPEQVDAIVDKSPEAIEAEETINKESDDVKNVCPDCGNSPCTCEDLAKKVDDKIGEAADKIENSTPVELAQFARKLLSIVRNMNCSNFSSAEEKVEALKDAKEEIDSKIAESCDNKECKDGECDKTEKVEDEVTAEDKVAANFSEVVKDVVLPPEEEKALVAQFTEVGKALENVDNAEGDITGIVKEAKEKIAAFCDKLDALEGDESKIEEIKKYFAEVEKELDEAATKSEEKKDDEKVEDKPEENVDEEKKVEDKPEEKVVADAPDAEKVVDDVLEDSEDKVEEVNTEDKDDVKEDHVESFSEDEVLVGDDMLKDDIVTEIQNEMNAEGVEIKKSINNFGKSANKSDTYGAWLSNML